MTGSFPIFRNLCCKISDFQKYWKRQYLMIPGATGRRMQYFVVMIDYGRRGREAVVDPEITRREVVSRIASGEYTNISFVHEIEGSAALDITEDILAEAALPEITSSDIDFQANGFDHARDLRKHEVV
jgi:hypothetical protein